MNEETVRNYTKKPSNTLLRAAYVASIMHIDDNFPHGLRKMLSNLEQQNWPISIPKKGKRTDAQKEQVRNINDWFETHLVRNMLNHIDEPLTLERMYEVMGRALDASAAEQEIIRQWLHNETFSIAYKKIEKQVKEKIKKQK